MFQGIQWIKFKVQIIEQEFMKSTKFLCLALIMCQNVDSAMLTHVSDVSQKMFGKAAEKNSKLVPDYFKTQEMCEKVVRNCCLHIFLKKSKKIL